MSDNQRISRSRMRRGFSFVSSLLLMAVLVVAITAGVSYVLEASVAGPRTKVMMPYVASPAVVVDGSIGAEEYAGSYLNETGIALYWEHDGNNMYIGLVSAGTGWVGIGFGPRGTGMPGSNIILGYVNDAGALVLSDEVSEGYKHRPDKEKSGVDNILDKAGTEEDGKTTIEFVFPLNSGDPNDHDFEVGNVYGFFLAYNDYYDDLFSPHSHRSARLDVVVESPLEPAGQLGG